MQNIVVTGANGFIGKNLVVRLLALNQYNVITATRNDNEDTLQQKLRDADIVFHLAGVNRPEDPDEYEKVNLIYTDSILKILEKNKKPYRLIFTSSSQAALDNPYGKSKLAAEKKLIGLTEYGDVSIFRLDGVFGKWCKPNYNSVVATFCHNAAHSLPITIHNEEHEIKLIYIDDVVSAFLQYPAKPIKPGNFSYETIKSAYSITLIKLAALLQLFKESRNNLVLPDLGDDFTKRLYSTYLTYLPVNAFSYPLKINTDERGSLYELLKTERAGQIFISTTKPGITRGNHYHHLKTEKFIVIQGEGVIRLRKINGEDIIEYKVKGTEPTVVDIPPGYTHNITNTGNTDMLTLFWANEIFNSTQPDTHFLKV